MTLANEPVATIPTATVFSEDTTLTVGKSSGETKTVEARELKSGGSPPGALLSSGDTVTVGDGGTATLVASDTVVMRLEPGTSVKLPPPPEEAVQRTHSLELLKGKLFLDVLWVNSHWFGFPAASASQDGWVEQFCPPLVRGDVRADLKERGTYVSFHLEHAGPGIDPKGIIPPFVVEIAPVLRADHR